MICSKENKQWRKEMAKTHDHEMVSIYPFNDDEVDIFIACRSKEDFIDLLEEYGLDKKQIKDILK